MIETKYLVDNNALVALTRSRIRSPFFRASCRVTHDVLEEAAEHPEHATLASTAYDLTCAVIEQIRVVMARVEVGDTALVDLYRNGGTADPGLVASALDAMEADADSLFPDTWIIVTNDGAVEVSAAGFGIQTIKPHDLAERIDESLSGPLSLA